MSIWGRLNLFNGHSLVLDETVRDGEVPLLRLKNKNENLNCTIPFPFFTKQKERNCMGILGLTYNIPAWMHSQIKFHIHLADFFYKFRLLSLFKQHYTYFHILFHSYVFLKNINNVTRNLLSNGLWIFNSLNTSP